MHGRVEAAENPGEKTASLNTVYQKVFEFAGRNPVVDPHQPRRAGSTVPRAAARSPPRKTAGPGPHRPGADRLGARRLGSDLQPRPGGRLVQQPADRHVGSAGGVRIGDGHRVGVAASQPGGQPAAAEGPQFRRRIAGNLHRVLRGLRQQRAVAADGADAVRLRCLHRGAGDVAGRDRGHDLHADKRLFVESPGRREVLDLLRPVGRRGSISTFRPV